MLSISFEWSQSFQHGSDGAGSASLFHNCGFLQVMGQEVNACVGAGRGQGSSAWTPTHSAGARASHGAEEPPKATGPAPGVLVSWLRMLRLRLCQGPLLASHIDGNVVEAVLETHGGLSAHGRTTASRTANQSSRLTGVPRPSLWHWGHSHRGLCLFRGCGRLITSSQDATAFTAFPERDIFHRGRIVALGIVGKGWGHWGDGGSRGEGL